MITRVDTVLIGKKCPSAYTTVDALTTGDLAVFDKNKVLIKSAAEAVKASAIYVGVVGEDMTVTLPNGTTSAKKMVEYSNEIQKESKPSYIQNDYSAPVQEKIEIDLTSAKIVIGHRYVLRIVYKDMYEAAGQFTHTYEVIASTAVADDLGNAFLKKINAHKNRRVSAAFSSHKLTLTAMEKTDNEGLESLNEYSVVCMLASLYNTIPGALLSNVPESVPGATIKKIDGKIGKGFWKQVRDQEVRMMGYKGHVFTGAYPSVEQDRKVVEGSTYDSFTIENDNRYLSCDNQYIKTIPLVTEIYVEANSSNKTSLFAKIIQSFITGVAVD